MKQIAILRGINVGGKRKILMADLRQMLEDLGYTNISTYIQSGNVLFDDSTEDTPRDIGLDIEVSIKKTFGYDVPVIVMTSDEILQTIKDNPFDSSGDNLDKLYLTVLSEIPDSDRVSKVSALDFQPDQFRIAGRFVYLRCELKYNKTKLNNQYFEKKLAVKATTRNWKTILKLAEMCE